MPEGYVGRRQIDTEKRSALIDPVFGLVFNWLVICPHGALRNAFELNPSVSDNSIPRAVVVILFSELSAPTKTERG